MQDTSEYTFAFCGETNMIFVDFSAGIQQSYVESPKMTIKALKPF